MADLGVNVGTDGAYYETPAHQQAITSANQWDQSSHRGGGGNRNNENNVLLCSIEDMTYPVTIEDIHRVFSLCGFVCKIATFDKVAGFQVLVQYPDVQTAVGAQQTLEGYNIFEGCCKLRISFSRHTDLNVKFNSDRSRDYTVGLPGGTDAATFGQAGGQGFKPDNPSNVLLVSVEDMWYQLTLEVVHHVFNAYGTVQKVAMFEKKGGFQALIQFPDVAQATTAKTALEGHQVYEGCCKLRISFSQHTNLNVKRNSETTWDYTGGALDAGGSGAVNTPVPQNAPSTYITPECFASQTRGLPHDFQSKPEWGLYTSLLQPGPLDPRVYFKPSDAAAAATIEQAAQTAGLAPTSGAPPPPAAPSGPDPGAAANAAIFGAQSGGAIAPPMGSLAQAQPMGSIAPPTLPPGGPPQ